MRLTEIKATFSATFEGTGKLTPRVSGDGGIVDDPTGVNDGKGGNPAFSFSNSKNLS